MRVRVWCPRLHTTADRPEQHAREEMPCRLEMNKQCGEADRVDREDREDVREWLVCTISRYYIAVLHCMCGASGQQKPRLHSLYLDHMYNTIQNTFHTTTTLVPSSPLHPLQNQNHSLRPQLTPPHSAPTRTPNTLTSPDIRHIYIYIYIYIRMYVCTYVRMYVLSTPPHRPVAR